MKRLYLLILFAFCALSLNAQIRFKYDLDFETRFDNGEYARSDFKKSCTIFGTRLNPMLGFSATAGRGEHRLMAGFDVMREFADEEEGRKYLYDLDFYYQYTHHFKKTAMSVTAGIFPRRFSVGSWSTAFFSDRYVFYHPYLTGILLQWKRPASQFEFGIDWMWKKTDTRREKFMLFSSGEGRAADWLLLGYTAYMLHHASSRTVIGVCDNILAEPYIRFDFARMSGLQKLSLSLGWLQALQRDRVQGDGFVAPFCGDVTFRLQHWGAGIENNVYVGKNIMPMFNDLDTGGNQYGTSLYLGDPFFQSAFYDRLNVYYAPKICRGVDMLASLVFHFHGSGLVGSQQIIGIKLNLAELLTGICDRRGDGSDSPKELRPKRKR